MTGRGSERPQTSYPTGGKRWQEARQDPPGRECQRSQDISPQQRIVTKRLAPNSVAVIRHVLAKVMGARSLEEGKVKQGKWGFLSQETFGFTGQALDVMIQKEYL